LFGRLSRGPSLAWRVWALHVGPLALILVLLGVVLDREIDHLLVDGEVARANRLANLALDRELGRAGPLLVPPDGAGAPPGPLPPEKPGGPRPQDKPGGPPGGPRPLDSPIGPPPFTAESGLPRIALALARQLENERRHVTIFSVDGREFASGVNREARDWPEPTQMEIDRGLRSIQPPEPRVDESSSPRTALLFVPIRDPRVNGLATLAVSLETADALSQRVRLGLGAAGAAMLLLTSLIAVPATRNLLSPLSRVLAAAERVADGDLGTRVGPIDARGPVGALAVGFDRMLDQIEVGAEAQRRFVADASHELRSPLTGVTGMVDVMRDLGPEDEAPRRRALNAIEREVDRMRRLIEDLLVLSRLDARAPQARTLVALGDLASEVVSARNMRGDRTVGIDLRAEPSVHGDPDALRRVVQNLIDNAVAATAEGGDVHVTVDRIDGRAEVVVADTGVGIPPTALSHLFDRFYRVDRARARRTGGSGLGLSIAHGIVTGHGGTIEACSEGPGRGSRFTVRLPATD
jgi:two-component system OmpR family sensor kinase